MLTPEFLESCTDEILGMYDALNTAIVADVSRRLVKTGTITSGAKWLIERSQESNKLLDDIAKDVAVTTKYSEQAVNDLFMEAGIKSIEAEANVYELAGKGKLTMTSAAEQVLTAAAKNTDNTLTNLTRTTAISAQEMYLTATDQAYTKVMTGAFSYTEAIKQAIKEAAEQGAKVYYPSGARSNLDVAVRRAVLTGVNQSTAKITEMNAEAMGCEYYEVSAHIGARPSHQEWQGQVYKIEGSDENYENFRDATGYGTGDGLCGYNCRHDFFPFFPGISERAYSDEWLREADPDVKYTDGDGNEKTMTTYEASQQQRYYERGIRAIKTELAGLDAAIKAGPDEETLAGLKEEFTAQSVRLKSTEATLKDFCKQTGRSYDSARTQVYAVKDDRTGQIVAFNRSVSSEAVWANRKATR